MSLFTELKRRNVFRVAAAYVVTAWLLIEIGNTLEETLRLPEWADTLLAFFLIIGFLPVLFFTWAYEITPEGIRREKDIEVSEATRSATRRKLDRLIVVVMALALVYFATDKWLIGQVPPSGQDTTAAVTEEPGTEVIDDAANAGATGDSAPTEQSLAVLPFANMSADPENEYFSDGISEELLNLLVDIDGLRVPSRTSSFAFKGMNTDIRDIAGQLNVGHILEGSVRKAGNRVRITAQLIDVSTDTHLWSETYDRELEDIFAIQDEIARRIVDELQVVLGTELADRKPTDNLEAYNLFLQGRHLFQQRGPGLLEAERLLMQAVELDPAFADAWATLAMTHVVLPNYTERSMEETDPKALEAARRALETSPGLAEPRVAMAHIAARHFEWNRALDIYRSVTESHPKHSLARLWYGVTLISSGYIDEAIEQLEESVRLDPVAGINADWLSRALGLAGEHDRAIESAIRAIRLGRVQAVIQLYLSSKETGQHELVAKHTQPSFGLGAEYFENLRALNAEPERYEEITQSARQRKGDNFVPSGHLARYEAQGYAWAARRPKETYEALHAVLEFDETIVGALWRGSNAWFINHPLGRQFIEEVGLVELWRQRGWPDRCRPAGEEEFTCE